MAEAPDRPASFLRRWSQRKLAAAREAETAPPPPLAPEAQPPAPAPAPPSAADASPPEAATAPAEPPLPDVASLTFDSDFTAFLAPKVDEGTRRAALRKLFADPRFNVMDGLDVYIDDYNKFEPITPDVLKQLKHVRYLFDPPKTRVNEHGHVEDVPDEPQAPVAAGTDPSAADADAAPAADAPAEPSADATAAADAAAPAPGAVMPALDPSPDAAQPLPADPHVSR
jgi:hypothetical protein